MKRTSLFLVTVFMGALACTESATDPLPATDSAVLPTTTAAAPAQGKDFVEKITGSGHLVTPIGVNAGIWRTFSMNAKKTADGVVTGRWQRVLHPEGEPSYKAWGTISCFTIVGNKAWIGGHAYGEDPSDVGFQVVDNGEGSGSEPDLMGLQLHASSWGFESGFAEDFCENTPDFLDFGPPYGVLPVSVALAPVEGGNIQIKVK